MIIINNFFGSQTTTVKHCPPQRPDNEPVTVDPTLEVREGALWKIRRVWAKVTLAIFAVRMLILPNVIDWWNSQALAKIFNPYLFDGPVDANVIHTWQIVAAVNAALTLGFYYFLIDPAPRRLKVGKWTLGGIDRAVTVQPVGGCTAPRTSRTSKHNPGGAHGT